MVRNYEKTRPFRLTRTGLLTTQDVAAICGVATRTVAKWCDSGLLPSFRIPGGRDRRVGVEVFRSWIIDQGFDSKHRKYLLDSLDAATSTGELADMAPSKAPQTSPYEMIDGVKSPRAKLRDSAPILLSRVLKDASRFRRQASTARRVGMTALADELDNYAREAEEDADRARR